MPRPTYRFLTLLAGLAAGSALPAQEFLLNLPLSAPDHAEAAAAVVTTPTQVTKKKADLGYGLDRWLDLNSFNYGIRYRSTYTDGGAHVFSQGQQKLVASGKFKFDEQGKYGIGFNASSGRYFNWAYADFIGGGEQQFIKLAEAKLPPLSVRIMESGPAPKGFFNSGGGQMYFRQAFLTAQPIKGIEAQFGGLALNHGVNTEATSYDDDGYMTGERISVRRPKQLFLSEASYTRGYLGDYFEPNFFTRGQRLAISNYWQAMGEKDFGKRLAVSADYALMAPRGLIGPTKTWREGIFADVKESRVFDSFRFEAYQRISNTLLVSGNGRFPVPPGKGFALTVARKFGHYGGAEAGVASIDNGYYIYTAPSARSSILGLTLNGDQYGRGRRYFLRTSIPITSSVSLAGNFSHLFGASTGGGVWNAQMLTAGFVVDGKKLFFPQKSK